MKILVLASGGLDSTVLLYKAIRNAGRSDVIALNIFYGQRHAKEREFFKWQCEHLGIEHYERDLADVFSFDKNCCSLLQGSSLQIEHASYEEQLKHSDKVSAYVPFRNGLFLAYASAMAIQLKCDVIYYGAHADDAAGSAYPDCTPEFIKSMTDAINFGTGGSVLLVAPLYKLNKAGVVKMGIMLGMTHEEFEHTWSCYEGKEEPCKRCATCLDRKKAFVENCIVDID